MDELWLRGWERIEKATGFSRKVLKAEVETSGLPIRMVGNSPVTTPEALRRWVEQGAGPLGGGQGEGQEKAPGG